jgi:hypothetical protein
MDMPMMAFRVFGCGPVIFLAGFIKNSGCIIGILCYI